MATVKGKHGGARPGAGQPPDLVGRIEDLRETVQKIKDGDPEALGAIAEITADTPLEFLKAIWNNPKLPLKERMRAAITAAQYEHKKPSRASKKSDAEEAARQTLENTTRLRPAAAPLRKVA